MIYFYFVKWIIHYLPGIFTILIEIKQLVSQSITSNVYIYYILDQMFVERILLKAKTNFCPDNANKLFWFSLIIFFFHLVSLISLLNVISKTNFQLSSKYYSLK